MPVNATTAQPLQEAVQNVLNAQEQEEFIYFINQYNAKRNVQDLFWCLHELLDTPAKKQLFEHVQRILSDNDAESFHQLQQTSTRSNGVVQSSTLTKNKVLQRDAGRPYQTLPTRGARVLHRPIAQTDFTGRLSQRSDLPNWEAGTGLPSRQQPGPSIKSVYMEQSPGDATGLGFSIRGGLEHGIGIYASYVEVGSLADRQGLVPGDQIISLNGVSFIKISHDEAAKLIQSSKKLDMEVRNVGRVPGSFETHQKYTWVDAAGRTVSPPPEVDKSGRYESGHGVTGERKSNLMLLKDSDERKINLAIYDHRSLGIMIRGGNEFGLGIYVTGIDKGSPAEQAGLKMGDQIMDVNGNSFLDIGHPEAAKLLRSSKHLMMTVKDVGKLPHTRTTYDQTQWIVGQRSKHQQSTKSAPATPSFQPAPSNSLLEQNTFNGDNSMFSRGAGSQLMHTSLQSQKTQHSLVDDRSRHLLNESERDTLRYYLAEYSQGHLTAADLATALLKLLNTQAKMDLVDEVRGVLAPPDLEKFDAKITNHNIKSLKSNKKKKRHAPSPPTTIPLSKSDQHKHSLSSLSSNGHSTKNSHRERGVDEGPLRRAIEQICDERELELSFNDTEREIPVVSPTESISGSNSSVVVVEVHKPYTSSSNTKASQCYDNMRSPSEDSGVDINGTSDSCKSHATSKQSHTSRNRLFDHGRRYTGPEDSDGSQELDLSSWESHPPDEVTYSIPRRADKRDKPKHWKEVALAKQNRRRSKSLVDLIGTLEAEHDNSLDKDNYLLKEQANSAKIMHPNEFVLKDIPIAANTRANSVSPSSSWRRLPQLTERSPSPLLAESRNWNVVEDNSSDEYSIVPYSRIKSIQASSFPDKQDKSKQHWDQKEKDVWMNSKENWRRRQVPDSEYSRPLPPPPDFSDSDDGKPSRIEPPRPQHQQDRFRPTVPKNVPSKPPRRAKSPVQSKPVQSSRYGGNEGAVRLIQVQKLRPTLGIAIEGGASTKQPLPRVIQIQKTGSAALSDLEVGHIILKVNGRSMEGLLHQDCARTIAEAFKHKTSSTIELLVKETKRKTRV